MSFATRLQIALKALYELGFSKLFYYAYYQLKLRSGLLKWQTASRAEWPAGRGRYSIKAALIPLPDKEALHAVLGDEIESLFQEAKEIAGGQVRLFGGEPQPLELSPSAPLKHWTAYREAWLDGRDIKFIWEPGRFGWASVLARAYYLSGEEKYAAAFWAYTERFLRANPPNLGPHWVSAQEVALRLICLVFSYQVFAASPETTPERQALLSAAIEAHARRIPPSISYARAQNNNHLVSEAAGLYTAGAALPGHPAAAGWRRSGWNLLVQALTRQIAVDGSYVQHSSNYQRLMLQLALWITALVGQEKRYWPVRLGLKLGEASYWLLMLMDYKSGQAPNLGANDGAYILPLTSCEHNDYRPVVNSATLAFCGEQYFEAGPWEEMALWFGLGPRPPANPLKVSKPEQRVEITPHVLRNPRGNSWAYLRAAKFTERPGHADQLHLDLWWRGMNVAQDAGSYLYNAPAPWDNALSGTSVHNSLSIDGREQMRRAGRFLWLDWAQAKIITEQRGGMDGWYEGLLLQRVAVQHNGYRKLGLTHCREVLFEENNLWRVIDSVQANKEERAHHFRLHWLLADWEWSLQENTLQLDSPQGPIKLSVYADAAAAGKLQFSLARAGERLHGEGEVPPQRGWVSPTYGQKRPALSFSIEVESPAPLTLTSVWQFPQ